MVTESSGIKSQFRECVRYAHLRNWLLQERFDQNYTLYTSLFKNLNRTAVIPNSKVMSILMRS